MVGGGLNILGRIAHGNANTAGLDDLQIRTAVTDGKAFIVIDTQSIHDCVSGVHFVQSTAGEFQVCRGGASGVTNVAGGGDCVIDLLLKDRRNAVNIHFFYADVVFTEMLRRLFNCGKAVVPDIPDVVLRHNGHVGVHSYRLFQVDGAVGGDLVVQIFTFQQLQDLRGLFCGNQILINTGVAVAVIHSGAMTGYKVAQAFLGQ